MSNFINDVLDAASESGWKGVTKAEGYLLFAPIGNTRPGYGSVWVHDPRSDSRKRDVLLSNLRKAGLIVYPEKKPMQSKVTGNGVVPASTPAIAETKFSSPYVRLRARVNDAMTALAQIETIIGEIEAEAAQSRKFMENWRKMVELAK